jgi:signal transduction histidine kinase
MNSDTERKRDHSTWRALFGVREKLSLCFASFLIIVIALGIQNILQLSAISTRIDSILQENFETVIASGEMLEGLQRIDNGVLFHLLGHPSEGQAGIDAGRQQFQRAFAVCRVKASSPQEVQRIEALEQTFARYDELVEAARVAPRNGDDGNAAYTEVIAPRAAELQAHAGAIQQHSFTNVVARHGETEHYARNARLQTLVVLAAAILLSIAAIYYSGRWLLMPIIHLTKAADEIRHGNLDVRLSPVANDELGDLVSTFNDMTLRLRRLDRTQKARLLKSNAATKKILDNVSDAIALAGPDGEVEMASRVASEVFGMQPAARLADARFPWIGELAQHATQSDAPVIGENEREIVQAFVDGEERFFFPSAAALWDDEGNVSGILMFFRDITDIRIQQELKQDAIATVSHQLKTPLTSIQMALHLLRGKKFGDLNPRQEELLETANDESDRLLRMVLSLLDMSRIRAGHVLMECRALPVHEMIASCLAGVNAEAETRDVHLISDCSPAMPEVWADPGHIEHVFNNLLSNAIRYTPAGAEVHIKASPEPDWICIEVQDCGPGIDASECKKIFEQFYRGPVSDTPTGAGLGLFIAKRIVEAHGGRIAVDGGAGSGACFSVRLPRADAAARLPLKDTADQTAVPQPIEDNS